MSYLFLDSTTNSKEEQSMSTKKQSRGRGGRKRRAAEERVGEDWGENRGRRGENTHT